MPFRDVVAHFQPEQLDQLTAVFDAAWPQLLFRADAENSVRTEAAATEVGSTYFGKRLQQPVRYGKLTEPSTPRADEPPRKR